MKTEIKNYAGFWMPIIIATVCALLACVIAGCGESAIAFSILIHAEIKCLEHDERISA